MSRTTSVSRPGYAPTTPSSIITPGTVSGNLITRYAYGWVNLLDDKIKVSGGLIAIADNVWGTQGDGDWDIAGNGLRLELKPIDGLDFGAFLHVPTMDNPVVPQYGDKRVRKVDLARTLGETSFGFRYTRPMFYASAQYWMDSDIDGTDIYKNVGGTITTETPVWSDAGDEKQLMFGAGLTGVPNLVATVEGNLSGLGNTAARGWTDLRQTVSYTLFGKLTLGMKAKELLWGYDIRKLDDWPLDLKPWMQFKPFANYKVSDEFTAGMEVGYGFGNLVNGDVTDRKFVNEKYDAYLKPNLAYNFKGGLALKAWYMFTAIGYTDLGDNSMFIDLRQSDSPVDKDNTVSSKPLLKQQVALEFAWSY